MLFIKTYGEKDCKGFILLQNRWDKSVSKHYISSVEQDKYDKDRVYINFYTSSGEDCSAYKPGTNAKVDKGVKTWICNARNKKVKTSKYSDTVFNKLFKRKK